MMRALAPVLCLALCACGTGRPEGHAIVVATADAPVNLDPRIGTDEASQKAHQLVFNTLVRIEPTSGARLAMPSIVKRS